MTGTTRVQQNELRLQLHLFCRLLNSFQPGEAGGFFQELTSRATRKPKL